jgi:hypothetical protein
MITSLFSGNQSFGHHLTDTQQACHALVQAIARRILPVKPRIRESDPRHRALCTYGSNNQEAIMLIVNWELLSADPFELTERTRMEDL